MAKKLPVPASIALLLIAIFSIQYGASLAKSLFPALGPEGATTLRLAFAAALLCLIWRPWRGKLQRHELRPILGYGIALGAMNLSFYLALVRLPLGLAVALEFTGPLSVALFLSRRPVDFLWAILAALGIVLVLPIAPGKGGVDPVGVAFALGAGAAWALYILLGKRASALTHPGMVTSVGMVAATLLVLPFGVVHSGSEVLNPTHLPVALAVAVLSSALPYSLEMLALKSLPARNFGILMSLEPAIAALVGAVSLKESLSAVQRVAIVSIMAASFGSSVTTKPQVEPTA